MKKLVIFLTIFCSILFLFRVITPETNVQAADSIGDKKVRLIVRFKKHTTYGLRQNIAKTNGATISEGLKIPDTFILNITEHVKDKVLAALNKNFFIDYAEEDAVAESLEIPNDPNFSNQWGMQKINASSAWDVVKGSNNVDIAIVDTGVNYNHPDLQSKIVFSVNCTLTNCPSGQTTDPDGHGTHVAGIAAAVTNNNLGIAGVSWNSRIMSIKVLDDTGRGYYSWITNGIIWAVDNGAEIINLSLGGTSYSSTLENAVNYAWSKGVLITAASGNSGTSKPFYPAYFQKVMAVAATSSNDAKASFSNYGTWVDVAAPGVSIISTYKNGYEYLSGTSMSTPFVSGLAALVISQNPSFTNSQVREKIETTSIELPGTSGYWNYGRIDLCAALGCQQVVPTLTPIPTLVATNTPVPTQVPTLLPTQTINPTLIPTLTPIPTPTTSPKPWYCKYVPWHY